MEPYKLVLEILMGGIALMTLAVIIASIYLFKDRQTMRDEIVKNAKDAVDEAKEEIELLLKQAKTGVAVTEKEAKKAKEITEEMKELKSAMAEPTPPVEGETDEEKEARDLLKKGNEFRKKEDFETAIYNYTKAIDKNPGYARAFSSRGNAYEQKKDHGSAIRDYTKAIELDPTNVVAVVSIGVIYSIKGDKKKARQWWEKAIEKKKYLTDDGKEMVRRWLKELEE